MTTDLKIRDFLNLESDIELNMFLQGTKKKTAQMKYNEFVKHSLEKFRPLIQEHLEYVDGILKACESLEALEKVILPALPENIREEIINHIDKQKLLNIVERVYLCLDLLRAITGEIRKVSGTALLHYGNAFRALKNLDTPGGRIIGLNGRPMTGQ